MSELKIDEKNLSVLIEKTKSTIEAMVEEIETVSDKKADLFERYFSMHRLGAMIIGASNALTLSMQGFRFGFDLQHPFFQTEKAKEYGWDSVKLEQNPFFVQEEEKIKGMAINVEDLPDEVKAAIMEVIKAKFKEDRKTSH